MSTSIEQVLSESIRGRVVFDSHTRGLYSTDASIYQVQPIGVVVPVDTEDAVTSVGLCGHNRVGMLPRGGGTSLAGQCVNEAVVIDVSSHCDSLLDVDIASRRCRVEAGLTIDDLNESIRKHGLFFAPDPSTARQATIGGCIGNNAAGVHSILYGRTSENVHSVRACLWDGYVAEFGPGSSSIDSRVHEITKSVIEIVKNHKQLIKSRYPKTLRRSTGYQLDVILQQLESCGWDPAGVNLSHLICGSEGTLAMVLEASLVLHHIPKERGLAVIAFGSVEEAIRAVQGLLSLRPAGIELLDDLILDLARENREQSRYVDLLPRLSSGPTQAVLYVEFFGETLTALRRQLDQVHQFVPMGAVDVFTDVHKMESAWKLRKAGEPLLHGIKGERKPLGFIEDCAIPVDRLIEFVERLRSIVDREGTVASYYAHASVGVLHVRPLLNLRDPKDEQAMHRIAIACADLAKELGGVASGEHGDGRARGPVLEQILGPELMDAHRQIKSVFDPLGLMNPGNIVHPGPVESISQRTRVRPGTTTLTIQGHEVDRGTGFRFDSEGGFGHAVEMCNGAGVCRKKQDGTMCPSYQGTLDERHSTRGRGNALRLAITGQSKHGSDGGGPDWDDPETLKTLDLCLSCKACKTECPSNVDIAKLKSEYLWQGFRKHGVPLRVNLLSRVHLLNKLGSTFPSLSNFMIDLPPVRSIINHAMGFHPNRTLPRFASAVQDRMVVSNHHKTVLLVSDSMTTYTEPEILHSACRVLEHLGYGVAVVRSTDLGRAAISLGNLGFAKSDGVRSLERLTSAVRDQCFEGILFMEPSSLSVVKDDWQDLLDPAHQEDVASLARNSHLVEDFIGQRWGKHPSLNEVGNSSLKFLIHTHCHQKSLWGNELTMSLFEQLGVNAELIDSGCCGMAGSFGFMDGKYDLSMTIAEQRLMPAIRTRAPGTLVVAGGTSCRHQILDATGVHALHPIQAIEMAFGLI